ncbi:MAG: glycoside hydrolase family 31 protein, partial [Niabella sp.]
KYFSAMRDAIQLRYKLVPYIYTSAHHAYETGESICLPMYYKHPEEPEAYSYKGQYYFGKDMIVSPVSDSIRSYNGLAPAKIWLPGGRWFDFARGKEVSGSRVYTKGYSLNQIPVFIKSGAIIPMFPTIYNLSQKPDTLILSAFPGNTISNGVYYEDDGVSNDYKNNKFSKTIFSQSLVGQKTIEVSISQTGSDYTAAVKAYRIDLYNVLPPDAVTGPHQLHWSYDYENFVLSVSVPATEAGNKVVISFKEDVRSMYQLLDGVKGKIAALNEVLPIIKEERALINGGPLPSEINTMSTLISRIKYHPGMIGQEVTAFQKSYPQLVEIIEGIGIRPEKNEMIINHLKNEL